ncbi:hypothetical protein V2J09_015120 [Rumex salicifolius]
MVVVKPEDAVIRAVTWQSQGLFSARPMEVVETREESGVCIYHDSGKEEKHTASRASNLSEISMINAGSEDAVSAEQDVAKEVEFPHQSLSSYVLQEDVDLAPKSNVMEELKYYCSILSLLPENYEIEKDSLIQLWMAAREHMELQEEEECFSFILINGYLVQSGSNFMTGKSTYRINIRKINELLESQKDKGSSYLKWDNEYQQINRSDTESIHHLSLVCTDIDETIFQILLKFSKLRTLLFLANYGHRVKHIPDQLFLCLENLQALDLSRTQIKELPKWLPDTICSLVELQTLKLRGCVTLCELPGELNRLAKLRHLDFDVLRQLEIMPSGIGDLVNLQTLSAFLVGTEEGCKIQELKGKDKLAGNLCIAKLENVEDANEARDVALYNKEQLEKLELRWTASEFSGSHNNSYTVLEYLQPWTRLEELRILCYEGETFPSWISNPGFNKLVRILFYCCENLVELPLIEQLPCLKHLGLTKMNSITKIERRWKQEKDVAFPKLETMEINEMQSLRIWEWKKSNEGDFTSLTHLIINYCPELEEFDVLRHLQSSSLKQGNVPTCNLYQTDSLEELVVEDCLEIQKKCLEEEGEDWYKIKHVLTKNIQERSLKPKHKKELARRCLETNIKCIAEMQDKLRKREEDMAAGPLNRVTDLPLCSNGGTPHHEILLRVKERNAIIQELKTKSDSPGKELAVLGRQYSLEPLQKRQASSFISLTIMLNKALDLIKSRQSCEDEKNRVLIVLDGLDSVTPEVWRHFWYQCELSNLEIKVLITTQNPRVAHVTGTSKHCLHPLSDDECFLLIQNGAKPKYKDLCEADEYAMMHNRKELIDMCRGLPLLANQIGLLLSAAKPGQLLSTIDEITARSPWKVPDLERVLVNLKSIFLQEPQLKRCLAYCSLFPEDYEFKEDNLVQFWMAEGFTQPSMDASYLEKITRKYFDHLLSCSLFQASEVPPGEKPTYKMHDLAYDLAQNIGSTTFCRRHVGKSTSGPEISSITRHFSLSCERFGDDDDTGIDQILLDIQTICSGRRTFLLFHEAGKNISKNPTFFQRLTRLRVLDLSHTNLTKLEPKHISELKYLRHLDLSHTTVENLPKLSKNPELQKLENVETKQEA